MLAYRFYVLAQGGRIETASNHECDGDEAALDHARKMIGLKPIECWRARARSSCSTPTARWKTNRYCELPIASWAPGGDRPTAWARGWRCGQIGQIAHILGLDAAWHRGLGGRTGVASIPHCQARRLCQARGIALSQTWDRQPRGRQRRQNQGSESDPAHGGSP